MKNDQNLIAFDFNLHLTKINGFKFDKLKILQQIKIFIVTKFTLEK